MLIKPKTYEVRRPTAQTDWSTGYAVAAPTEALQIKATVMPVMEKDLELLPEGVNSTQARSWLSKEPIYAADELAQRASDEVLIEGHWYAVHRSSIRPPPLSHCDATLIRKEG